MDPPPAINGFSNQNPPPPPPPLTSVSMGPPKPPPSAGDGEKNKSSSTFAKTVKFIVFSGIAISVIKSINPFDRRPKITQKIDQPPEIQTPATVAAVDPAPFIFTQKPNDQKKVAPPPVIMEKKIVEVTSGDTLWGLSRKHGVSIEVIKQVNGLSGDIIHVGEKLIIP
ncbi:hypothetical protein ACFE04_018428 [Oxalis oulophora]